jgi:predicted lipoprotein with Yx(FWY)xxD motif
MIGSGVALRRSYAVVVLLAAIALAAWLIHTRLDDGSGRAAPASNNAPAAAAPAQNATTAPATTPATEPAAPAAPAGTGTTAPAAPAAEPVGYKTTKLIAKDLPKMGTVVTDDKGWTLYRFDQDTANPPSTTCNGDCATKWPPVLKGEGFKVEGIAADKVGTVKRADGGEQLTIAGWPVYRFAADETAGKWKGQAVGNVWYVIAPTGKRNLTCLPPGAVPPSQ